MTRIIAFVFISTFASFALSQTSDTYLEMYQEEIKKAELQFEKDKKEYQKGLEENRACKEKYADDPNVSEDDIKYLHCAFWASEPELEVAGDDDLRDMRVFRRVVPFIADLERSMFIRELARECKNSRSDMLLVHYTDAEYKEMVKTFEDNIADLLSGGAARRLPRESESTRQSVQSGFTPLGIGAMMYESRRSDEYRAMKSAIPMMPFQAASKQCETAKAFFLTLRFGM